MGTKSLIILTICFLQTFLMAHSNPGNTYTMSVSEIRRVKLKDVKDAKDQITQIKVSGLEGFSGDVTFTLVFFTGTGQETYVSTVKWDGTDKDVIFDGPVRDANSLLLTAKDTSETLCSWNGNFAIQDLKARVAFIDGDYVRVTPGDLDSVTDGKQTCKQKDPCYFKTSEIQLPPAFERCRDLKDKDENVLKYCDDTVSDVILLESDTSFLLLDDTKLNLKYEAPNTANEVLVTDESGLIDPKQSINCDPDDPSAPFSEGCSLTVSIPEKKVDLTRVSVDEEGYVEGSKTYPFENFAMEISWLSQDAVRTSWSPSSKNQFDVFVTTASDLYNHEFELSGFDCGGEDANAMACESFFINLDRLKEYVGVVQRDKNAIAKTLTEKTAKESTVSKIYSTSEGVTTFTVTKGAVPQITADDGTESPMVKLIEVIISDKVVSNAMLPGTATLLSEGVFEFECPVLGTFEHFRQFLLVEYSQDNTQTTVQSAAAAYFSFVAYDVDLDWVADASVLRENVKDEITIVIAAKSCDKTLSPCYLTSIEQTESVSLCTQIENGAPIKNLMDLCEDKQPETPPVIAEDPSLLLLLDESSLNLRFESTYDGDVEVLVTNTEGEILQKEGGISCEPSTLENIFGCAVNVNITEGTEMVNIAVVHLDDGGIVNETSSYEFEMFEIDALRLTDDAVMTSWTSSDENQFTVTVKSKSNLDEPIYSLSSTCDGTAVCEAFFVSLKDVTATDIIIAVQITSDKKEIARTVPTKEPLSKTSVVTISNTIESEKSVSTFMLNKSPIPSSVKMMEVISISEGEVSNQLHMGEVSDIPDGYSFRCEDDIRTSDTDKKFLFLEYDNKAETPGHITGVAAAYINFVELDVQLDWLGNSSVLREFVNTEATEITIGKKVCDKDNSPCYLTPSEVEHTDLIPLCTPIENTAYAESIIQCDNYEPAYPPEMKLSKLILKEEINSSLVITAPSLSEAKQVKLIMYINEMTLQDHETSCTLNNETSCVATDLQLPNSTAALRVLVICTDEKDAVTESAFADIDHLEFITKKINDNSLMVYWTAAKAKEYIAELMSDELQSHSNMIEVKTSSSSDIICDTDDSCYAMFLNLEPKIEYHLSVHKKGDSVSSTEEDIGSLDKLPPPEGDVIDITKISRVDDHTTKVYLSEAVTSEVKISVRLDQHEPTIEETGKGTEVNNDVYSFSHLNPLFDSKNTATFTFIGYKGVNINKRATAEVVLQNLDATVAWVGDKRDTIDASMRVDTGSLSSVKVGSKKCSKEESPCYYIEDSEFPDLVESCVDYDQNVTQCNEEVTSYNKLYGVELSLDGNQLDVTADNVNPDSKIEVKIYDKENTSAVFSIGTSSCVPIEEEGDGSFDCKQPLQMPNDGKLVRVIVSEINPDGVVLKSVLKDFQIPGGNQGVEPWVIAVSVLGSVFAVTLIAFVVAVVVKKKKARKWQSRNVEKELDAISEISVGHLARGGGGGGAGRTSPPLQRSGNYPDRNPSRLDEEPRRFSKDNASSSPFSVQKSPSSGHDNMGYSSSPYSKEGAVALPRVTLAPNRASSSLYNRTQL